MVNHFRRLGYPERYPATEQMPLNPEIIPITTDGRTVELLCHCTTNVDNVHLVEQSKLVAKQILSNIDELTAKAHAEHSADIKSDTYLPYRIATLDALEPIVYLRNTQADRDDEIHVYVNSDYKYGHSELVY